MFKVFATRWQLLQKSSLLFAYPGHLMIMKVSERVYLFHTENEPIVVWIPPVVLGRLEEVEPSGSDAFSSSPYFYWYR